MKLKISVHEFETPEGRFIGMNAGENTGIFAPLPIDEDTRKGMMEAVQARAEYFLGVNEEDLPEGMIFESGMTLADIKASIRENIVPDPEVQGAGGVDAESKTFDKVEAANEVTQ